MAITHENDELYLITMPLGQLHFKKGEVLITGTEGVSTCSKKFFDERYELACDHSFVKSTGKKSKQITWYCIHCEEIRIEEVNPISEVFKIKK